MKDLLEVNMELQLIKVSDILNDAPPLKNSPASFDKQNDASEFGLFENSIEKSETAVNITIQADENGKRENTKAIKTQLEYQREIAGDNISDIQNPIGYLQELCIKKQIPQPVYGIEKVDGPPHRPSFYIFCRVGDYYRVVSSTNKKDGKSIAAREIIRCMNNFIHPPEANEQLVEIEKDKIMVKSSEFVVGITKRVINYVGCLQEMCIRKRLPPPIYGTENEYGPSSQPTFHIYCKVGMHKEVAIANNKREAKHMVAEKVLRFLEQHNTDTILHAVAGFNHTCDSKNGVDYIIPINKQSSESNDRFKNIPNPIGYLQEICVKKQLAPPVYGIESVSGPPHCPTFYTFCRVGDNYETVTSSNKKKGKEMAARMIIMCLKL